MEPAIFIAYYSTKTLEESRRNGEQKMFSRHTHVNVPDGSIIVGVNTDTNSIARVSVSSGKFELRSLLDIDVFTGTDAKYQRSELKLKSCRDLTSELPLSLVGALCGLSPEDKTRTNVNKRTPMEYARVFYKGENEDEVLAKYRTLILALL